MEIFRKCLLDARYPAKWIKDAPLDEILAKPGMQRLYTLQWCLSKFDGSIEKYLAIQDDKLEAALWEVVTKMLLICSDSSKDREIFEGNGQLEDQINFWKKIFHIVDLAHLNIQPNDTKQNAVDILGLLKPHESVNLIPIEMKIASCDPLDNANIQFEKQNENIQPELEPLRAKKNLNPTAPTTTELSLAEAHGSEGIEGQEDIDNFHKVYSSKLERVVERSIRDQTNGPRREPSQDNALEGVAPNLTSDLSQLQAIHQNFMKMKEEVTLFMRHESLQAPLENRENTLKDLLVMVTELKNLDNE